ncbi:AMIN-like domain-containing (lipo)protein [Trueperella bialowiezensis]|uniref:AMIN-like domain-containing protein n=1 Tax=Trueperella bialowiezensis TaxID=312285 RepID=A0A3S4VBS8_9ACTO|nr:hypothetical protein [Trueperella bialowiezensis]VEI14027.1 Uncharacterised protein [Trueperella bialowiezensis]
MTTSETKLYLGKRLFGLCAVVALTLSGCSNSSEEAESTPSATTASASASPTATPEPTPTDEVTPSPSPEEPALPDVSVAQRTGDYLKPNEPSQSPNWPHSLGQALPIAAAEGPGYFTIEYDASAGEMIDWYTDGWAEAELAVEEGSGLPIDVNGKRALQIFVSGIRYPEPTDPQLIVNPEYPSGLTGSHVSGPFEGMHSIVIGADEDMPYRIETKEDPMTLTIFFDKP